MRLAERKEGDILVVEVLDPRIDAEVAEDFKRNMTRLYNGGNRWIVLNLEKVNFIDSIGLSAVISSRILLGKEGEMAICGLHSHVKSVFKFTRMDKVFRMFPSEAEAVAALRQ